MTPGGRTRTIVWEMLGRVDYEPAEALQHRLREQRIAGRIPDMLLLLEHPPVLTIGRGGNAENILASTETLSALGIRTHMIGRGETWPTTDRGRSSATPSWTCETKGATYTATFVVWKRFSSGS